MSKFHWGHGIAVFYVIFVATLIVALVASTKVDHSLVVDDYYAQDIAYQERYDKTTNELTDNSVSISYSRENGKVVLEFTEEAIPTGTIHFYRASDKSLDFFTSITDRKMEIPTSEVAQGKWRIKIDWKSGDKKYYKEEDIFI